MTYASAFLGSAALALVFTPLVLRIAVRRNVLDHPADHKGHASPIPYLGGVAMCAAFAVASLLGTLLWERPNTAESGSELAVALALALGLCLMGLVDDLRGLGPGTRLVFEVVAGVLLYSQGVGIEISNSDPIDLALTVFWVVAITNAFNLLDNMDGLSAGVAAIAAGAFFVIAVVEGQHLVAVLSVALAGCALGFLRHNVHPARIYMGDAGSLFLGFMLAYLGLKLRFTEATTDVTVLVPLLVLAIPILDTALVTLCRIVSGRNPFSGGRDHISHRLVHLGASVPVAVGAIYTAAVTVGGLALLVSRLDAPEAWAVAGAVGAAALAAGMALARVPVYEAEWADQITNVRRFAERRRRAS